MDKRKLHKRQYTYIQEHIRGKLYTWDQGLVYLLRIQKEGSKPLVFNIIMN